MVRFKTSAGNEIWHVENDMKIVGVNTKARISVSTGHNDNGVKDVLIRYSYPKSRILRGMNTLNIQFSTGDGDVYIPDRHGFSTLCRHGYLNDLVAFFRDIMIVISDDIGPEYMIPNDLIARSFVIVDGEEVAGDRVRIVTEYDLTGKRSNQWSGKDHIGYNMHDPMGRIRFYREFIPGVYNNHAMTPSYGMDMVYRLFANNISVPESFMILSLRDVLKTPDDFCSMLETKSVCGFILDHVAIRCEAIVGVYSLIMDMAGIYRSTILNMNVHGDDEEFHIMDGMVMQTIMEVVWKQYRDHITPSDVLYRDIGAFVRDFLQTGEASSSEKVMDIGPVYQESGPAEINGVSIILKGNSVAMDIRMMNDILLTKDNMAFRDMVFHGIIDPDSHLGFRNVLMVNETHVGGAAFDHNMVVIGYSDYDNRIYVLNDMLGDVPSGIEEKFFSMLKKEKPQRVSSSDDPDSLDFDFDADVTDIPLPPVSRMSFAEFGFHVANGLLKAETSESDQEVLSRLMAYVMDAMVPESVEIDDAKEVERLVAIMSGGDIHSVAANMKVQAITSSAGSFFSAVESLSDHNGIGIEFSRIALNEADRNAVGVLLVDSSGHAFYLYASESSRGIAVCSSSLEHAGIVRSWIMSKLNDETGKLFFTGAAKRGRILSADEINGDVDDVRKSTTPACYDLVRGLVTLSDKNAEFMDSSGKSTSVTEVSKTGSDFDRLVAQKGYVRILKGDIPNSGEEGISNWKFLEKGLPAIRVSSKIDGAAFFDALIAEFPYFRSQSAFVAQRYALCRKTGKPFCFPPMLLNGAPGIGKTRWSRKIADMTGTGSHLISMAGTNSSLSIIGSERGYREARPGMWAFAMRDSQTANPIMILDEIDKTNNGSNGSAIESLLPFLEKETSRRYHDRFLMTEVDVSMISYIMTSNAIRTLPEAFLSRIRLFECRVPTMEEINVIFGNIVHDIVSELGMDDADIKGLDFDDIRRSYADNHSIRVLRQGIEKRIMKSILDIDIDDKNGLNGRNAVGFRM